MNTKAASLAVLIAVLLTAHHVFAQPAPQSQPSIFHPVGGKAVQGKDKQPEKGKEKQPDKDKKEPEKKLTEPSPFDFFAQTPSPSGEGRLGFNPHMLGDVYGKYARRSFTVFGTLTTTTVITDTSAKMITVGPDTTPITATRILRVPVPNAGGFKVAENASPRPQDRVFGTYNYFDGVRHPKNGSTAPSTFDSSTVSSVVIGPDTFTTTADVRFLLPGVPRVDLHRETFGFEKTFLDGFASIEVRLPLLQQQNGIDGFNTNHVGDLTINGKYALFLDPEFGDVFSAGLAITAPTGPAIVTDDGTFRSTLFQPWFGYIYNFDRFYVQGFHSIVVPTDRRDVTILFNDVGLNWWLFVRDQPTAMINFIVPTLEVHVTTPLNQQGATDPLIVLDQVVMTAGVHFGLFRSSTLTFGAAAPVTGPNLFSVEAFVQYNRRF